MIYNAALFSDLFTGLGVLSFAGLLYIYVFGEDTLVGTRADDMLCTAGIAILCFGVSWMVS